MDSDAFPMSLLVRRTRTAYVAGLQYVRLWQEGTLASGVSKRSMGARIDDATPLNTYRISA